MPRSREEILERYRACAEQLGRVPGRGTLERIAGIKQSEVDYYWPTLAALAREAGLSPNSRATAVPEVHLLKAYSQICLHLKKVPSSTELRIAIRERGSFSLTAYTRPYGSVSALQKRFKEWIENERPEFSEILKYNGWSQTRRESSAGSSSIEPHTESRPFLPTVLQGLDRLSRGEKSSLHSDENVNTAFERRCADAFRCLGFEVESLGQGRGRKADCLALARQESFGVIIDSKVRQNGYVLGTEDRKFLEYAVTHSRQLQSNGIPKVYFVVIGSGFRESDLTKLTKILAESPIRSVDFITAIALMRIVEESIRHRHSFRLIELDQALFGNKIIAK
ncbi:MAG: hypothetical protein H0U18_01765 [Pyrinomonadaceae bacterium]|jgi:hypothetical protein|nr:hypothetical protein [Pyrinomonadaceae bacterium]